jgi:thiol-disulfide isomerase/thioredoxin
MRYPFFLLFLNLLIFTSQELIEVNHSQLNKMILSNKDSINKKILVLFYIDECENCPQALNVLNSLSEEEYKNNNEIIFTKVNCNSDTNIFINMRFNITNIPHILIINGNFYSNLGTYPDKYNIKNFIQEVGNKERLLPLPDEINSFDIIINNILDNLSSFFIQKLNINLGRTSMAIILIILFLFILYFLIRLFSKICCCCYCCCRKKEKINVIKIVKKEKKTCCRCCCCRKKRQEDNNIIQEEKDNTDGDISGRDNIIQKDNNNNDSDLNDDNPYNKEMSNEDFINKYKMKNE